MKGGNKIQVRWFIWHSSFFFQNETIPSEVLLDEINDAWIGLFKVLLNHKCLFGVMVIIVGNQIRRSWVQTSLLFLFCVIHGITWGILKNAADYFHFQSFLPALVTTFLAVWQRWFSDACLFNIWANLRATERQKQKLECGYNVACVIVTISKEAEFPVGLDTHLKGQKSF